MLLTVANAATLQPGPVAPGSLISIFGSNLAPAKVSAAASPSPRSLAGVTLSIGGIPCPILFVSPGQINAQVPFETAYGPTSAVLQAPGAPPAAIALNVAPVAPGIFTVGQAASADSPMTVYLTGQGPVEPPVATGASAPSSPVAQAVYPVIATLGGRAVEVMNSELNPGSIGLFQVTVRVPALKPGSYPLFIKVNGAPSNVVNINVFGNQAGTAALTGRRARQILKRK